MHGNFFILHVIWWGNCRCSWGHARYVVFLPQVAFKLLCSPWQYYLTQNYSNKMFSTATRHTGGHSLNVGKLQLSSAQLTGSLPSGVLALFHDLMNPTSFTVYNGCQMQFLKSYDIIICMYFYTIIYHSYLLVTASCLWALAAVLCEPVTPGWCLWLWAAQSTTHTCSQSAVPL